MKKNEIVFGVNTTRPIKKGVVGELGEVKDTGRFIMMRTLPATPALKI